MIRRFTTCGLRRQEKSNILQRNADTRRRTSNVINSLFDIPWRGRVDVAESEHNLRRQQPTVSRKQPFRDVFDDVAKSLGYFNSESIRKVTERRKFEREREKILERKWVVVVAAHYRFHYLLSSSWCRFFFHLGVFFCIYVYMFYGVGTCICRYIFM